jgi:hypothetical protein
MLDQHDASIGRANARGERSTQGPVTPERMDDENHADNEVEEVRNKRHRSSTPDVPRKRVCDDSIFPWVVKQKITSSKISSTLALTWKMVLNYSADIKLTKWSLLNDKDVPEFPDSEWTNVLSGKAINLDVVFSGTLSTFTDNKTVQTLSEFELLFGAAKPSKTVETHGDWVTAWRAASRAIKFAFLHRAEELEAYHEYVTQYFAALQPRAHPAVFNLDHAIRKYVGSVRNCELHHFGQFRHFETRFLHSCGVGASGTAPSNEVVGSSLKKNDFRINEPCHLWNNNACARQASSCRYKHLCEVCGGKHRKPECKHDPGSA